MSFRFAIPSKGSLYDDTLAFFDSCGLKITRPNPRRYTAGMIALRPDRDARMAAVRASIASALPPAERVENAR